MKKTDNKYILFSDTVYTLLLYVLFFYEQLDETIFIFSDGVPKKIRDNFIGHIYLNSGKGSNFSSVIRINAIFKLLSLNLKKYQQFGQDHLFYSFLYMNKNFTLIEDGTANYQVNIRGGLYSKIKSYFLKGREFGFNNKVNKIILTSKDNLPQDLLSKIEIMDIHTSWDEKTKYQQINIANLFEWDFSFEHINKVLVTQYFSEFGVMTEVDKVNMYKTILSMYDDSSEIYIKPHPKEDTVYSEFFNNKIISPEVPFQLIELVSGGVDTIITCTSSVGLNTKANIIYHDISEYMSSDDV